MMEAIVPDYSFSPLISELKPTLNTFTYSCVLTCIAAVLASSVFFYQTMAYYINLADNLSS